MTLHCCIDNAKVLFHCHGNELTSVREVTISAEGVREVIISADERL
jgi:hypothetical protein